MARPWAKLPNAKHINRIIRSVKENPDQWDYCYNLAENFIGRDIFFDLLQAPVDELQDSDTDLYEELKILLNELVDDGLTTYIEEYFEIIVYLMLTPDDCTNIFKSKIKDLRLLAKLGDQTAATLLFPCMAFKIISVLN